MKDLTLLELSYSTKKNPLYVSYQYIPLSSIGTVYYLTGDYISR